MEYRYLKVVGPHVESDGTEHAVNATLVLAVGVTGNERRAEILLASGNFVEVDAHGSRLRD